MSNRNPLLRPKFAVLLNQPSILLLGLTTILAFIALQRFPKEDDRLIIYVGWGSIFLFILLWRVLRWYLSPADFSQNKDVIDIYVKITGGALVVLTIFFSWINFKLTQATSEQTLKVSERTLDNSEMQKISEHFTKALEDLGGESIFHHLAGIYAFRRMEHRIDSESVYADEYQKLEQERDSERALIKYANQHQLDIKVHREMVDVLTHFIQEVSPWKEPLEGVAVPAPATSATPDSVSTTNTDSELRCRVDVYETIKLLAQRKLTWGQGEDDPLNLVSVDLRDCSFFEGNFNGAIFRDANLTNTKLQNVQMFRANLDSAILIDANLTNANLTAANLRNADLTNATLTNADLTCANFDEVRLYKADLTSVKLWKDDSLEGAYVDQDTKCPQGFTLLLIQDPEKQDPDKFACRRNQ